MAIKGVSLLLLLALLILGCTDSTPNSGAKVSSLPSVATSASSAPTNAPSEVLGDFQLYENAQFSMGYPKSWSVSELEGIVLFNSPTSSDDAVSENVNVLLVPTQKTLESFVEEALGPVFETPGTALLESSETSLSGKTARKIVYTENSDNGKLQYLQVISVQENMAVLITYTATLSSYKESLASAESMMSAFKLKTGTPASPTPAPAQTSMAPELVRKWRVYSQAVYYDSGGHNFLETPATTLLQLNADQTWTFSSSSGTWSAQAIEESDWLKWGVPSYGPTRKLVLVGWNGETNDGPIEESEARVDFMWVIYRVGPPAVSSPAQIQMKFGQTYG